MTVNLSFRPAVLEDFSSWFESLFSHCRHDRAFKAVIEHEWKVFLDYSPKMTIVVEDLERQPGERIVGLAQTVFVTDQFVQYAQSDLPPYINEFACKKMPDGSFPLLAPEQVCRANAGAGLNALTTRWGWKEAPLSIEDQRKVRGFLDSAYALFYKGYNYKYLLISANSVWACEGLVHAGYRLISDYRNHYPDDQSGSFPEEHPYLLGISREEAVSKEGSGVSRLFDFIPPRFQFSAHQQDLLWWALLGCSDQEAAAKLYVELDTVKKRWAAIYDRIEKVDGQLLPAEGEGVRGAEKRRRLLQYLRSHLEEIRPFC